MEFMPQADSNVAPAADVILRLSYFYAQSAIMFGTVEKIARQRLGNITRKGVDPIFSGVQ